MRRKRIFELDDPQTGDGLAVDVDGERLVLKAHIDGGRVVVLVLSQPGAGLALARALLAELEPPRSRGPRRVELV